MPNVRHIRAELALLLPEYDLIRDCLAGERSVKKVGLGGRRSRPSTKYLPMPNPEDQSRANYERFNQYVQRAVFYNVTKRTLAGLAGEVFTRDPQITLPDPIKIMEMDATGSGLSLVQLAKRAVRMTIAFGRCGLFVDYPATNGPTTKAQIASGQIRPTMALYAPWDIINWRQIVVGGVKKLSLVVISESYLTSDDGFEAREGMQFRVARLVSIVDDVATEVQDVNEVASGDVALRCQVEIWQSDGADYYPVEDKTYFPTDVTGKYLDYIPFTFIGAENNDTDCDNPPLFDLASLNIAHFRNSADYEDSAYMVGQPTPWASGLNANWIKEELKGGFLLGSRASIMLPPGAQMGLLQAQPNGMIKEAMDAKERQMVALGAKLVEQKQVQRTATEAEQDEASETSALSSCAQNVGHAFLQGLKWAAAFVMTGADELTDNDPDTPDKLVFDLNTEFDLAHMSPDEINAVVNAWQKGALTKTEMRTTMRRSGYATLTDAEYETAIEKEQAEEVALMAKLNPPDPTVPPNNTNNNQAD